MNKSNDDTVLMIVQMSDSFSKNLINKKIEKEEANKIIIEQLFNLIPEIKNSEIVFTDSKSWKYALPMNKPDESVIEKLASKNIFIVGDSLCGKGRVDGAILTGLELGDYFLKNKLVKF